MANPTLNRESPAEFDAYAACYRQALNDSIRFTGETGEVFARLKAAYVVRLVSPFFSGKLLDYGCGVGWLSAALLAALPDAQLHGYDPSRVSLEHVLPEITARGRFTSAFEELDSDYDVIVVANVLHHVPLADRAALVRSLAARLAPGGMLAIFEHNPLNPLTRHAVASCVIDADAVLLRPAEVKLCVAGAALSLERRDYVTFFPRWFAFLRPLERLFAWCPLGAQYVVVASRNDDASRAQ